MYKVKFKGWSGSNTTTSEGLEICFKSS